MEKTFLDYYRANLHYIRSSAKDFAAEFPKIASRLEISAFDCEDPYIERLLEGTAFLAAKVDERISRGFPRMLESVVSAISPKSLFPNPSFGVVACNFDSGKFSSSGIEIKSNEIMEVDVAFTSTKCKFSPCWSVNFAPIKIKDVKYITNEISSYTQNLGFTAGVELEISVINSDVLNMIDVDYMDLYINMTDSNASMLLWQLMCDMESIILKTDKQTIEIKDFKVELPAFYNNDSLLYSAQMQFTGLNALQNFFIYPDMFKFVRIYGIKRLFQQASESHGKLIFAFKKRRNELQTVIGNDSIMTNCLPVINIFKMKSSRGYTNDYYEYHIVPNNVAANDYEVYNIESINFYDNINNLLLTAKPFYYTDVEVQFNNNYDYFAIHRRPRSDGLYTNRSSYKGYEVFASISGEKWQEVRDEIVQYSADLICTNRDLPLYIKANTKVSFAASQIESGVFINAPTKPLNPLINSGRREDWEKINHIMLNLSNILWKLGEVPVKIIKNIIKSYSLLSKDDTERILTSIVSIESEPATFRYINGNNGIFYEQGWKINMVISESKINDIGFFTFACVLWQFFQSYIPINSHIEFNVYSESYGLLKQWIM